jgi:hypothetical protein
MKPSDRRSFLKHSLLGAAAVSFADQHLLPAQTAARNAGVAAPSEAIGIIDTDVNLFGWPFRALKYRETKSLVAKLKKHRIIEAWAGKPKSSCCTSPALRGPPRPKAKTFLNS